MKLSLSAALLSAALLAACQTVPGGVSVHDISRSAQAVTAQIVSPAEQPDVYFDADGQYHSTPQEGGFYRKVLGKTASGGFVVQDFYQDSNTKQTGPFVIFRADGLRNFSMDVVDGFNVWYRPDGSVKQSGTAKNGSATGVLRSYDANSRLRIEIALEDNSEDIDTIRYYDEKGRLQGVVAHPGEGERNITMYYPDGRKAIEIIDGVVTGYAQDGSKLTDTQTVALSDYLGTLIYDAEEEGE